MNDRCHLFLFIKLELGLWYIIWNLQIFFFIYKFFSLNHILQKNNRWTSLYISIMCLYFYYFLQLVLQLSLFLLKIILFFLNWIIEVKFVSFLMLVNNFTHIFIKFSHILNTLLFLRSNLSSILTHSFYNFLNLFFYPFHLTHIFLHCLQLTTTSTF